jgi:hypothetical protein
MRNLGRERPRPPNPGRTLAIHLPSRPLGIRRSAARASPGIERCHDAMCAQYFFAHYWGRYGALRFGLPVAGDTGRRCRA